MPDQSSNGGRGDWLFGGMRLADRADAAFRHFKKFMHYLADFYDATAAGEPAKQQAAAAGALRALQDQLRAQMLNELLPARLTHLLGTWPAVDASEDALNLRVIKELHATLDWMVKIAPLDSINAARADLKRLEQRHAPRTLRRDYADPRERDELELAEREFAVLLTHFVAGARQLKIPALLRQLCVRVEYEAFRKWARKVDQKQRDLMLEAGRLSTAGGGLPLAQAARLSTRSQDVLLRDDPDRFPALAGLSDEEKLSKLFRVVSRTG
jgi:hypothetical protein